MHVRHLSSTGNAAQRGNQSRVRVDTVGFEVADCRVVCFSLMRSPKVSKLQHLLDDFGRKCAVGQGAGVPKHVGPKCLWNANTTQKELEACRKM
jgi:hypothetical protein